MAFVTRIICKTCGIEKQVTVASGSYTTECDECTTERVNKARREWLAGRKGLTIEERLEYIEAWIYDYRAPSPFDKVY